jgi:hypothetical protein
VIDAAGERSESVRAADASAGGACDVRPQPNSDDKHTISTIAVCITFDEHATGISAQLDTA